MVSTYLPKLGKVERCVTVKGNWRNVIITRPTVKRNYIDMDQHNFYYLTPTKSMKWPT